MIVVLPPPPMPPPPPIPPPPPMPPPPRIWARTTLLTAAAMAADCRNCRLVFIALLPQLFDTCDTGERHRSLCALDELQPVQQEARGFGGGLGTEISTWGTEVSFASRVPRAVKSTPRFWGAGRVAASMARTDGEGASSEERPQSQGESLFGTQWCTPESSRKHLEVQQLASRHPTVMASAGAAACGRTMAVIDNPAHTARQKATTIGITLP